MKKPVNKAAVRAALAAVEAEQPKRVKLALRKKPLWDLERDGITFSLLTRFIICRHRFWIRTVLGLRSDEGWNPKMEYGSLFHAGLEAFAASGLTTPFEQRIKAAQAGIKRYSDHLLRTYVESRDDILFWTKLGLAQFDCYARHWQKKDEKRVYVSQEEVFDHQTLLPSGRTVRLRGKYDEVFRTGSAKTPIFYNQENKSKGEVDELGITQSLQMDLQTMLYVHTLDQSKITGGHPCNKILYNVILRPNGGKYPKRQKKTETPTTFTQRLIDDMYAEPSLFFHRWDVTLNPGDLDRFRTCSLYPILEQLYDWWESIKDNPMDPWKTRVYDKTQPKIYQHCSNPHHSMRPFGVWDSLALGNRGDYFDLITRDSYTGLKSLDTCFPELESASLSER